MIKTQLISIDAECAINGILKCESGRLKLHALFAGIMGIFVLCGTTRYESGIRFIVLVLRLCLGVCDVVLGETSSGIAGGTASGLGSGFAVSSLFGTPLLIVGLMVGSCK